MSKEEFMKLSSEEMYNKYAEAESFRKSNLDSMLIYSDQAMKAKEENEKLQRQVGDLKNVVISLSRML